MYVVCLTDQWTLLQRYMQYIEKVANVLTTGANPTITKSTTGGTVHF
jgi:hypothetical protein